MKDVLNINTKARGLFYRGKIYLFGDVFDSITKYNEIIYEIAQLSDKLTTRRAGAYKKITVLIKDAKRTILEFKKHLIDAEDTILHELAHYETGTKLTSDAQKTEENRRENLGDIVSAKNRRGEITDDEFRDGMLSIYYTNSDEINSHLLDRSSRAISDGYLDNPFGEFKDEVVSHLGGWKYYTEKIKKKIIGRLYTIWTDY